MTTCGYRTGLIKDASRTNWQNNGDRPIAWSAWYPTEEKTQTDLPPKQFFEQGDVIHSAKIVPNLKLPVVLLSHGTGGTAESLGWLARALVHEGYVVVGANHHGNTGLEPYLAEGFLCWWERATDLSVLLTSLGTIGFFADRLDFSRVSAVGFSLGGYTVLALAGAKTSMTNFDKWRRENNIEARGPKEFPDAMDSEDILKKGSKAYRQSWARRENDYTDSRIKSIVAIAPAPTVQSFEPTSISNITIPTTILTSGADEEAPSKHCADWLVSQNQRFQRHCLGQNTGHYTFLEFPSDKTLVGNVDVFTDHESVNRAEVHKRAANITLDAVR